MTNYSELLDEIRAMREEGIPDHDGIEGRVIGICTTCKHKESCVYLQNSVEPVYHCEEFYQEEAAAITTEPEVSTEAEDVDEVVEYKGLCKNCDHRMTCVYSKSESGIWNCEEYE